MTEPTEEAHTMTGEESETTPTSSGTLERCPASPRRGVQRSRSSHAAGRRWLRNHRRQYLTINRGLLWDKRTAETEAELQALVVMATHDLKNPLASVAAHVDMLRADYAHALGEGFTQDLAAIERGLHRMTQLTQDLLRYVQAGHTLTLTSVSLQAMADDVTADHVSTAATAPEIIVAESLPDVLADATLLRHVLDNLVGNAIKYTRPGMSPRIEIKAHQQSDGSALVEVTDNGIGIPATDRSRVFDTFHRCPNSTAYPGTGLGLAICKRVIERHGGHIGVNADPAGGSRFWFTLPAHLPNRQGHTGVSRQPAAEESKTSAHSTT